MDRKFARRMGLNTTRLMEPVAVFNVDGTQNKEGEITHFTMRSATINGRTTVNRFMLTDLGGLDVILGLPWLRKEDPIINWKEGTIDWKQKELKKIQKECFQHRRNIRGAKMQKPKPTEKELVPKTLHRYLKLFSKETAGRFPPRRKWDHRIDLKPNFVPEKGKIYNLSPKENRELRDFIDENMERGYIRPTDSPQTAPFFFVKKKDGTGRPCQDYRHLNDHTIKNSYPIPRITELMDRHANHTLFTKMDLRAGYNNVRIRQGDE
jgi:hypothetical protein